MLSYTANTFHCLIPDPKLPFPNQTLTNHRWREIKGNVQTIRNQRKSEERDWKKLNATLDKETKHTIQGKEHTWNLEGEKNRAGKRMKERTQLGGESTEADEQTWKGATDMERKQQTKKIKTKETDYVEETSRWRNEWGGRERMYKLKIFIHVQLLSQYLTMKKLAFLIMSFYQSYFGH